MSMTIISNIADTLGGKAASAILTAILVTQPVQAATQASIEATATEVAVVQVEEAPAPEPEPTVQDVLLGVCTDRGYGEDCARSLLGMMWKESSNIADAVGDRGLALGYFQIHYRMHKVAPECAVDLKCSAEWSIKYMERNGYPKNKTWAVQCHNGCGINNGYAASALRHGDRLWNQPMAIKAVQLAAK